MAITQIINVLKTLVAHVASNSKWLVKVAYFVDFKWGVGTDRQVDFDIKESLTVEDDKFSVKCRKVQKQRQINYESIIFYQE